jgi:hypothetical protein
VNRLARTSAAVVAVAAALTVVCLPATAFAENSINNATTSTVSGDVFSAGHSNSVGAGDGTAPSMG